MVKEHFGINDDLEGMICEPATCNIDSDDREVDTDNNNSELESDEDDGENSEMDESDETQSDSDEEDEEDVDIKAFLVARQIEDMVNEEKSLPENVRTSRYYRRAKKQYFNEITESKSASQLLNQLTQVPEAVSMLAEIFNDCGIFYHN